MKRNSRLRCTAVMLYLFVLFFVAFFCYIGGVENISLSSDRHGQEYGDRLLSNFTNILRNTLPSSSMICRWGGDEFSVMLTGIDREEMDWYTQELQKAVTEYNQEDEAVVLPQFRYGFSEGAADLDTFQRSRGGSGRILCRRSDR